jgi:hypothetical protein
LRKSSIVSNCSIAFSCSDLVRDFSREFYSLRYRCSTPR